MNKKKIMSLIMALVMLVGVFSPLSAFANNANEPALPNAGDGQTTAKETKGTIAEAAISTTKPKSTKLFIHKLQASTYDNKKVPAKHNGGKLDSTTLGGLGTNVKPLNGVKFKYFKIDDEAKFRNMVENSGSYKTEKQVTDYISGITGTEGITATVGTDEGVLTVKGAVLDLPEGNYWFIETGYDKDKAGKNPPDNISSYIAVPFGITLPLTNTVEVTKDNKTYQPGTVWLSEVHTYPKNVTGKESIPKKTVGNEKNLNETHEVGKEQTWFLQATIPSNIKDYESITMRDVFFKGLTYKGLEEVYFGYDGMDENDKVKLDENDYTLTQPAIDTKFTTEITNPITTPATKAGEEFKLVLKEGSETNKVGIAKIAEKYEAMKAKADAKGEEVKVYAKVKTVINEEAKISTNIPNTFDLKVKIKGQPESKPKTPDENPYVKTGGKKFKKIDKTDNNKALEDAVFTIKHKVGGETAPTKWEGNDIKDLVWTKALLDANKEGIENGKFAVKSATKEEYTATSTSSKPTEGSIIYVRSGNDGTFEIKGLEYSKNRIIKWDKDTKKFINDSVVYNHYALKEVKAPKDYALLDKEIPFTIDDASYYKNPTEVTPVAADPLEIDNKKLTIPQTGGMGTVLFTVVGISLMAGAVIAMKKNRGEA